MSVGWFKSDASTNLVAQPLEYLTVSRAFSYCAVACRSDRDAIAWPQFSIGETTRGLASSIRIWSGSAGGLFALAEVDPTERRINALEEPSALLSPITLAGQIVNVGAWALLLLLTPLVLDLWRRHRGSPHPGAPPEPTQCSARFSDSRSRVAGLRLRSRLRPVGRLIARTIAVVGVAYAVATYGLKVTDAAGQMRAIAAQISGLVWRETEDSPTVRFLSTPPSDLCGLFVVEVELRDGAHRQSFLAVRDRRLNRLHNILRILPDNRGRFEAELGVYFAGGDYDIVVITPRHESAEQLLRRAEVAPGKLSPPVEGYLAPDTAFAFYAYGPTVHVPDGCDVR